MIRMAPNGRTAAVPVMLGMGAPVPLLSMIGIAGVLVLKSSDPSEWLRTVGGPVYAVIALAFVAAANLGTAIAGIYASAVGLRNYSLPASVRFSRLSAWRSRPCAVFRSPTTMWRGGGASTFAQFSTHRRQ